MIGNVLTLKQLEALVWLAELGSFRKAAQHWGTTQPNISSRIAGLEKTLNVVLMQSDAGWLPTLLYFSARYQSEMAALHLDRCAQLAADAPAEFRQGMDAG